MDLSGKVALVTGGASGMGFAFTNEFLHQGSKVMIVDVNAGLAIEVIEKLRKEFGKNKVSFVKADVSDKSQFETAFRTTLQLFGNVDILINNAGICNDKEWEREIAINLQGTINGVILGFDDYIKNFKSDTEGVIVNIASVGGFVPVESFPVYTATKHGVIGLTKAYGSKNHYKRSNVKILALCPGATKTEISKIVPKNVTLGPDYVSLMLRPKGFQTPEAVAKALIYVIKHGETGSIWIVEDGQYFEVHLPKMDNIKYQ